MVIHLGHLLPGASCSLPEGMKAGSFLIAEGRSCLPIWPCSGWGLPSYPGHPGYWWALTSPFHPYPAARGGLFSVALSL